MAGDHQGYITQFIIVEKNRPLEVAIGEACRVALQPIMDQMQRAVREGMTGDKHGEITKILGEKPYQINVDFLSKETLEAQRKDGTGQAIVESMMGERLTAIGMMVDGKIRVGIDEKLKEQYGIAVVQACHAAVAPITTLLRRTKKEEWGEIFDDETAEWIYGTFTKDVREASQDQIIDAGEQCFAAGIAYSMRNEKMWCFATKPINKGKLPGGIKKLRRLGND